MKNARYRVVYSGHEMPAHVCLRELLAIEGVEIVLVVYYENDQGLQGICRKFSLPGMSFADLERAGPACLPMAPDILLNVTSEFIFSDLFLAWPQIGAFNLHPGPLPRYAGFYPYVWCLINGETEHGVTLHRMTKRIDAGSIFESITFSLTEKDTGLSVYTKCGRACSEAVRHAFQSLKEGTWHETVQDLDQRRYYRREVPFEGRINFGWHPVQIERFVRALDFRPFKNPLRVPWVVCGNKKKIELLDVSVVNIGNEPGRVQGEIIAVDADKVFIGCKGGVVSARTVNGLPASEGLALADLKVGQHLA